MNGRPYASEILKVLSELQKLLPKDRSEVAYTAEQIDIFFDAVVQAQFFDKDYDALKPDINKIKARLLGNLKNISEDQNTPLIPSDIENALVKTFYSHYFEKVFTLEHFMSIVSNEDTNPTLSDYHEKKFFLTGSGEVSDILMEVDRGMLINGKKITGASQETIVKEIDEVIENSEMTEGFIHAYSQLPSYVISNLISNSLIVDGTMIFNFASDRAENLEVTNDGMFFHCNVAKLSIVSLTENDKVLYNFGGLSAKFQYEKLIQLDNSVAEGFRLVDIKSADPYVAMVLTDCLQYTSKKTVDYIENDYPELCKKMLIGNASLNDLFLYLIEKKIDIDFIYTDMLFNDIKQKILESPVKSDGVKDLIKLDEKNLLNNMDDIAKVCCERLDIKPSKLDSFFQSKVAFRDPEIHLFYLACASYEDVLAYYPKVSNLVELINAYQKYAAIVQLHIDFSESSVKSSGETPEMFVKNSNDFINLINEIKTSSVDQDLSEILKSSPLATIDFVKKIIENLVVDPKDVEEKFTPKQSIFSKKY